MIRRASGAASILVVLIALLTFCQSASAQSRTWPNDAAGRPAPPCTLWNEVTGRTEFCSATNGIPVSTRSATPSAELDGTAYGKKIFAGTGARGAFGFIDTISTRASGPFFALDGSNFVAVLTSDTDTNADIYRTSDGGKTWGYPTTVNLAVTMGAGQGGVTGSVAHYIAGGAGFLLARTTDFITFTTIDLSARGSTAQGGMTASPTRLHLTGRGTSGADVGHLCRSNDLNPTAAAHWTCQQVPTGGQGSNAGNLFVKQQSIAYVPGTTGTLIAVDSPSLSNVVNVYRTTDDGATWSYVTTLVAFGRDTTIDNNPGNSVRCQTTTTGTRCVIASGNRIYTSTDAGATWTLRFTDTSAAGDLYGIVFFDDQPDLMLVVRTACTGIQAPMGVRSTDAGETWAQVIMDRCSSTTLGRGYTSFHAAGPGQFLASLTAQSPFLAFASPIFGAASVSGTEFGETKVSFYSKGEHVGQKQTYSAGLVVETATAAGTGPFMSICGSATRTVRIKLVEVNGSVATAATRSSVILRKTSTATSGGTATALTMAPHSSENLAATATLVNFYTVLATPGTSVGVVGSKFRVFPITATVAATDYMEPLIFDFRGLDVQPVTLRAVTECVEAAFGATTTNAPTLLVRVTWTEE